ncbi:MAG TPA: hypothetical protein VF184_04810, partial [Phycisphaeraceae bacterium]
MRKHLLTLTAAIWTGAALLLGGHASAGTIFVGINGVIDAQQSSANVGDWMQVGPDTAVGSTNGGVAVFGTFTSYTASPDLPQVGADLNKFGWAMVGTVDSINP